MADIIDRERVEEVRRRVGRPLVTVFGNSAPEEGSADYEAARAVGRTLAEQGYGVVNGGYGGTMAASARGAREGGGIAVGVTLAGAVWTPNRWLTETVPTPGLLERLLTLAELGEAYVVLPGGTGTLLELAYVWEMMNKRLMWPRPILLYDGGWSAVTREIIARQPKAARWVRHVASPAEAIAGLRPSEPQPSSVAPEPE